MISSRTKFLGVVVVALGFALAFPAAYQLLVVDACLDGGGSFDYTRGVCDAQASHPYAPSLLASPWMILLGTALAVAGLRVLRTRKSAE